MELNRHESYSETLVQICASPFNIASPNVETVIGRVGENEKKRKIFFSPFSWEGVSWLPAITDKMAKYCILIGQNLYFFSKNGSS